MKKKNYLSLILIMTLFITIGFAALRTNLQINGTANFKGNSWDIHFENIQIKEGSVTATTVPTSNNTTTTEITYEIDLEQPGDFYEFTVDVVNKGSIDAMVETTPTLTLSDPTLNNVVLSSITYVDGTAINQYDLLSENSSITYKVRVEYKKDIQNSDLVDTDKTITVTIASPYIQADSNAVEVIINNDGKVTYYEFGEPTTSSPTNYSTLGKQVFISLSEGEKKVCIIRNGNLTCFKNDNEEASRLEEEFGAPQCHNYYDGKTCSDNSFHCEIVWDSVYCTHSLTNSRCSLESNNNASCE